MGKRGPAPTPTNVLKLRGSSVLRKGHRKNEPPTNPGRPKPQSWMTPRHVELFNAVCDHMATVGTLEKIHGGLIARYVEAQIRFEELTAKKLAWKPRKGVLYGSQWDARIDKAGRLAKDYEAKLGITPADKANVQASTPKPQNDPRERFFRKDA